MNRRPPRTLSGKRFTYFSIPSRAVTDLFYSRVSGRRIKLTSFLAPFFPILLPLLFTKGKKHYLTISFDDGKHLVGAIELKLHKSNYRSLLRSLEAVSNVTMKFDQEGIADKEEGIATRDPVVNSNAAVLEIKSDPPGADVEIDGAYAGSTPRTKRRQPGEYKIKISKRGYEGWEKKVKVEAGEDFVILCQLQPK